MTELIVTPSLISDLSSINKELKIKSNIEKLTFEEFTNENNISLLKMILINLYMINMFHTAN